MSSLAIPYLDLAIACRRHTLKRSRAAERQASLTPNPRMRPNDPSPLGHAQNRLARRFGGEVIDTLVDNHADMAADVDKTERKGGFR